jgi:hypothetical protein
LFEKLLIFIGYIMISQIWVNTNISK